VLEENPVSGGNVAAMIHIQKVDLKSFEVSQIIVGIRSGKS
jgi:hypothetical protein